jgi:SAM-dependent methyltransferase
MSTTIAESARSAYATLAPHYDLFTQAYRYDVWLARLEALARAHGLAGRRVLDVACGTGKSYRPLIAMGYEVSACDISSPMLDVARRTSPRAARLFEADMRALPDVGSFDLVTCLDDAVNYLLADDDLGDALASMAARLSPGGLLVFDTNTLAAYRSTYTAVHVAEDDDVFLCWQGHGFDEEASAQASATISIFERDGQAWARRQSVHRQRYWTPRDVTDALADAAMTTVAIRGQRVGAHLDDWVDEDIHTKTVYLARAN